MFSIGRVKSMAVSRRRAKKYAGFITLHLLALSIFKRSVLKLYFASLSIRISKLLLTFVIKITGNTIARTKRA